MEYKLLDYLASVMKMDYLSDLKRKGNVKEYIEYVRSIHDDAFPLEDWREACTYLLGGNIRIETVAEGKAYILEWLSF